MQPRSIPSRRGTRHYGVCLFVIGLISSGTGVSAQTPSGWLIHDLERPQPPVVTPAPQSLPVLPPADAQVLFDGTGLKHWRSVDGGPARWVIRDDYMESVPDSGKLVSAEGFGDIQLHVEWASPATPKGVSQQRGNSGVFLMGKYEIQVLDSFGSKTYPDGQAAAIYGQYPPMVNACLAPGEWQSYDILFRRPRFDHEGSLLTPARLDVIHNGVWVHVDRELWGPTSWLQNRPYEPHAERLPLALQDHGNPVRYRNIWLRELPEAEHRGPSRPRPHVSVPFMELARYVGLYELDDKEATYYEVKLEGGRLWLLAPGRVPQELVPTESSKFFLRHTGGYVIFHDNARQECESLSFFLGGREYLSRRVPMALAD